MAVQLSFNGHTKIYENQSVGLKVEMKHTFRQVVQ
jgi:hypothetical protein